MLPMSARKSVVLPAPLRPMSPHISPSLTSREALRTTGTGPMATSRLLILSMDGGLGARRLRPAYEVLHARIRERLRRRPISNYGPIVEREHAIREARHD